MRHTQFLRGRARTRVPLLLLFGLAAGVVNGLLGAGGGILIVYALGYALGGQDADARDLYANALCVMLPISALSCMRYAMGGHLSVDGFSRYVLPALLGGLAGGLLLGRLKTHALKKLFGALVIYSGLVLIIR